MKTLGEKKTINCGHDIQCVSPYFPDHNFEITQAQTQMRVKLTSIEYVGCGFKTKY